MRPDEMTWGALAWLRAVVAVPARRGRERGDVPGWVMVTLMSAILVVAILVPFKSQILPAIQSAINSVISAGNG